MRKRTLNITNNHLIISNWEMNSNNTPIYIQTFTQFFVPVFTLVHQ